MKLLSLFALCAVALAATATPAEPPRLIVDDEAFVEKVIKQGEHLLKAGRLVRLATLQRELNRRYADLKPMAPSRKKLSPPELFDRLRQSTLALGLLYKCQECADWHFNAATAFVVSPDGIVSTSYHVVWEVDEVDDTCHLIAADADGQVYPVREVVAADPEADTCLLRIDAQNLVPLPLRPGARPGERVYCLSHPAGNHFMFTEGMVARVCRIHDLTADFLPPAAGKTNDARPVLCLNITAEFSPGSSGGPVVDESGNVLAQVQSLAPDAATEDSTSTNLTILSGTIRYCIAAEEILPLFKRPPGYQPPPLLPPVAPADQTRPLNKPPARK